MEPDKMYTTFTNWWYSGFELPATVASTRTYYGGCFKGYTMYVPHMSTTQSNSSLVPQNKTTGNPHYDIPYIEKFKENYNRCTVHASSLTLKIWQPYQPGSSSYVVATWPSREFNSWLYIDGVKQVNQAEGLQWIMRLPHVKYAILHPNSISNRNIVTIKNYFNTKKFRGTAVTEDDNSEELRRNPYGTTDDEKYEQNSRWYWNIIYYKIDESGFGSFGGTTPFSGTIKLKYYTTMHHPTYPYNSYDEDVVGNTLQDDPIVEDVPPAD